ncbi:MAG: FAD:protein FMN transferase [Victivallales bacterium]|nr:FAD:protein FMN transferase [Victivallales bacterium]
MVFNTVCKVTVYGDVKADKAFQEIIQKMSALHDLINVYAPDSELSRLNATAFQAEWHCSDELWAILCAARKAYAETEGAFDPTVGPLMKLWGFHGKRNTIPTDAEIASALAKVGLDKVVFDDEKHTVRFTREGIALDFGGIAKGYACDVAGEVLRAHGVTTYMIDLGGNIQLSEQPPKGQKLFTVGIRNPMDKEQLQTVLELKGCSVATSGNYERSRVIDGKRIGHIMDPKDGRPGEFHASVTAVTPRGVDSDIFSTAVFVRGEPLARKLVELRPGTSFLIVDEDKTITVP